MVRFNTHHKFFLLTCLMLSNACVTTHGSRAYYIITIRAGDSLDAIAKEFDVKSNEIARINHIENTIQLEIGERLKIYPGARYLAAHRVSERKSGGVGDSANSQDDVKLNSENFLTELAWPLRGQISSVFGNRGWRQHTGIDIRSPKGTNIQSAHDGIVTFAGWRKGYGNTVQITGNSKTFSTLYAHCLKISVRIGQTVRKSQVIAQVGRSGNATGYHLHFEVLNANKVPIDPMPYLNETAPRLSSLNLN